MQSPQSLPQGGAGGKMMAPPEWMTDATPRNVFGLLNKYQKTLLWGTWQKRFFLLQEGVLFWTAGGVAAKCGPEGPPGCKGKIDFRVNAGCQVTTEGPDTGGFAIHPPDGGWVEGDFTGKEKARVFYLDATGTTPDREKWVQMIREHMAWAVKTPAEREAEHAALKAKFAGQFGPRPGQAAPGAAAAGAGGGKGGGATAAGGVDKAAPPQAPIDPERAAVEEAKAAHKKQVEGRAEERRMTPVIQDATAEEIAENLKKMQPRASMEERAEEIVCD